LASLYPRPKGRGVTDEIDKRQGDYYLQPVEEFAPFFQEDIDTLVKCAEAILSESFTMKNKKVKRI
jgi:hypothetical protein